ncbi:MAG: GntG family PLP-dependent aldolase [Acidimicrobiales bacterium]
MGHALIDLRSDTVTQPTDAMRRAMAAAEVGDDAYGEDPTVRALEERFAAHVGKEAALFVPSGTMANQLALRVLARPGTLVVAGRRSHVVAYENGAGAYNTGAQIHGVDDETGTVAPDDLCAALDGVAHHQPPTSVVCLENTHMPANGAVVPVESIAAIAAIATPAGVAVHLDGARLWNASVSSGTSMAAFAAPATTVMCCLSKGLCAPVGSLLAGGADLVAEARAHRQRLGGGMRQAGIIAAAGILAMGEMIERLVDDHRRATVVASAVAERWPGSAPERRGAVATNIVTFPSDAPARLIAHLEAEGVRAGTIAPGVERFVTHRDVDDDDLERVRKAIASAP